MARFLPDKEEGVVATAAAVENDGSCWTKATAAVGSA